MKRNTHILGVVQDGKFVFLNPVEELNQTARLTSIQMQEARSPESGELNLNKFEGKAIMVQGHNGGGWIYSAKIVDKAGPILTAVAKRVFRKRRKRESEK